MNESKWIQESRAYAALQRLMEKASEVRNLFEAADIPLPPPLARMLGAINVNGQKNRPHIHITPPKPPSRPPGAKDDWIWIPIASLTETGLVLGVLSQQVGPMSTKDVLGAVKKIRPEVVAGTVYNVIARVKGELLEEHESGWKLIDSSKAPFLFEGFAWGNPNVFQKAELAAHRREAIVHILKANRGGLMNMQIVHQLQSPDLCQAPLSKDLVKTDLIILRDEGRVRQIGNSRKYTAD